MRRISEPPAISAVIPVWRETALIERCVAGARAALGAGCEIMVVDGERGCATLASLSDPFVIRVTSLPGRGPQQNAGARAATGNVLLFLHADTILPPDAGRQIDTALGDPAVSGGAFRVRFDSPRLVYRAMSWWVSLRTRVTRRPFGDQGVFLRRDAFERIGGFASYPILEDVDLMRRLRRDGQTMVQCPGEAVTSVRRMEHEGILGRVLMNGVIMLLFSLGVSPRRLVRFYAQPGQEPAGAG